MPNQAESRTLKAATVVFFVAFLLLGLLVFRDYGMSWDEIPTRQFGIMYVEHQVPDLRALDSVRTVGGVSFERFGPIFEIVLVRAEKFLQPMDIRNVFYLRHLVTFFTFFIGVVLFHRFCRRRFGHGISLLACVCLVVSPTLFSHAFYNVKDISFLTMFVATMLTLDTVLSRPSWQMWLLHALTSVILLGTRVLGLFAMMLTAAATFAKRPTQRTTWMLLGYAVLVGVLLPVVWPVLQIDFVGVVGDAVRGTTSNPYTGVDLFRGRLTKATELPWDYVPTWIVITTPVVISVLFLVGAASSLVKLARHPREYLFQDKQRDLLVLCWFFLPVLGCVVLRPTLYDGWRHLFFVYPAMVYLAAAGMETIVAFVVQYAGETKRRMVYAALTAGLLLCLAPVVAFMLKNHPFEHVYFNRFAGSDMKVIKQRFELDYWGLSYREALEYIVRSDSSPKIRIYTATYPGRVNIVMLNQRDRGRIDVVHTPEEADYVMTNYRYHPQEYPYGPEVFGVRVGNASINSVFYVGGRPMNKPAMQAPAGGASK
jgi:hypothetical protein